MATQLLNFMQRVSTRETNLCIQYIKDASREVERSSDENILKTNLDIVRGQSEYDFPSDFVKLIDVNINKNLNDYKRYSVEIIGRKIVISYNSELGTIIAPEVDFADGIQLIHTGIGSIFVDSSGVAVTNPDETSYINFDDNYIDSLLEFVRASFIGDDNPNMKAYKEKKALGKMENAEYSRHGRTTSIFQDDIYSL